MKCALAGVGFINEDIEYNKAVLADTLRKCAGRADVVRDMIHNNIVPFPNPARLEKYT